jgi:glycosyltransferase involved in cell wall biosynthesis
VSGSSAGELEARRTLVREAWRTFLRRARVEAVEAHGSRTPVLDQWILAKANLSVGIWDASAGGWRSPEMMAQCSAVSSAAGGRLLVTKGAPGDRDMLLFDRGEVSASESGVIRCFTAFLDRQGGMRIVPAPAVEGAAAEGTIHCAANGPPPLRRRRCLMINLVDWRSLASGSAQHQLGLLRAWSRAGYEVRMIAPGIADKGGLPGDLAAALTFSASLRRFRLPSSLDTLTGILSLMAMRMTWKPDIVFSRVNSLTVLLVAVCRLIGLRVVIDHNGWLAKERQQGGGNPLLSRIEEWSQVTAAKWAHGSRCVTRGMAEALRRQGVAPDRLCVVGNGTDSEDFRPVDRSTALAAFGLPAARNYVGFLGNVVPWHRVDVAIAAFATIAASYPRWDLVIFGDGPSIADLRRQAEEAGLQGRVLFMGRIESSRANLAINCLGLGIVPLTLQRDTAFGYSPVKIRDYAAAGCPVLTGAVPDNLELDGMGWLFTHTPDDPRSMAGQLARLLGAPDVLGTGAELARAYAVAHFDWDEIGGEILRRLDDAPRRPHRPGA